MLSARATSRPFQVVGETPTRDPLRRVPGRRARAGHRRLAARLPRRLGGGTPARRRRRRELGRTGARREPVSARVSAVCGRCPQGPGPSHSTLRRAPPARAGRAGCRPCLAPAPATCHGTVGGGGGRRTQPSSWRRHPPLGTRRVPAQSVAPVNPPGVGLPTSTATQLDSTRDIRCVPWRENAKVHQAFIQRSTLRRRDASAPVAALRWAGLAHSDARRRRTTGNPRCANCRFMWLPPWLHSSSCS